jgi:hypothetical protein
VGLWQDTLDYLDKVVASYVCVLVFKQEATGNLQMYKERAAITFSRQS